VQELAIAHGHRTPSYAAVARVVRAIFVMRVTISWPPSVEVLDRSGGRVC
jgi:putative transposase